MSKFVLDASAALQAVLNEPYSATAIRLIEDYRAGIHELLAPDIYPAELGHALTRAERKKVIPLGDSLVHFAELMTPPPRICPSLPLMARAVELSSALRMPTYDLIYKLLSRGDRLAGVGTRYCKAPTGLDKSRSRGSAA